MLIENNILCKMHAASVLINSTVCIVFLVGFKHPELWIHLIEPADLKRNICTAYIACAPFPNFIPIYRHQPHENNIGNKIITIHLQDHIKKALTINLSVLNLESNH